ncbi:GNAT family N-acetyltransferase [Thalassobius aquimarinus]|uniref:Acyl-homoserine-lactone synthase n=2 Tax=Thalassovita aquimarina TaxID=2785917 RepID=A0ABS5HS28_9RHOB|nr:acyl-homoserine-lactone synthase [Thalassovita aquimarina]MBR9651766.1 GNAT family N-acetyltransferase [Thalassovita aquimarina]
MIIVVDALNRHLFSDILAEMHALRARVFADRLGWEVTVKNGMEIDEFDALNPAHVICLDDDGDVVGCMRLLQTTGPHMLADVFYDILDGEPPLRSSRIWEATRFCVDTEKLKGRTTRNSISYVTSEVMIGAFEYARDAGVLDAVAVIDPVMNRVMQRSRNAPYDYLGTPKQMGKVKAMAALMDCSEERIAGIRDFAGINHDVFGSDDEVLSLFKENNGSAGNGSREITLESAYDFAPEPEAVRKPTRKDLREYCEAQVASAANDEEKVAALALKLELAEILRGDVQNRCDA